MRTLVRYIADLTDRYYMVMVLSVASVLFVTTAIFSEGFHHPDEHFQIIEFARARMGEASPSAIPWEYREQIRPTLQPVMSMFLLKTFRCLGMDNPFTQAMMLRLVMAIASLIVIYSFGRALSPQIKASHRKILLIVSYTLWFIPAVNVRFSSETLASLFFMLSLSFLCDKEILDKRHSLLFGMLAGLSFECRYQMAFAYVGILLWMLFVRKYHYRNILYIVSSVMVVLLVCTMIDCWFYGNLVIAPYNYFKANILDGIADRFGISPFHEYLYLILMRPTLPIGVVLCISIVYSLINHWRSPVVWAFFFFLLGHSLVGHKELRFLFPVINLFPVFLVWGYDLFEKIINRRLFRLITVTLCLINYTGLALTTFKPAAYGKTSMMRFLDSHYGDTGKTVYVTQQSNPFNVSGLETDFYKRKKYKMSDYVGNIEIPSLYKNVSLENCAVVFAERDILRRECLMRKGFKEIKRSIPAWIEKLNVFYAVYDPQWTLIVYEKAS